MYYIYAHVFCMAIMVILILIALSMLVFKPTHWVKKHMFFAGLGIVVGFIGIGNIALRYTLTGHTHLMTFHSQIGLSTIITLIITMISGVLVYKGKREYLFFHKLLGIVGFMGIIGAVFLGVLSFIALPI